MAVHLSDTDIAALIAEAKPVDADWRTRLRPKEKRGHTEGHIDAAGSQGNDFVIMVRQSTRNALAFSAILAVKLKNSNVVFRLRRYNGKAHEHTNAIEGDRFYDFHVHMATQRYQEQGAREDGYAEPTDRFSDLDAALKCLASDCNLVASITPAPLLGWGGLE